MGCHTDSGGSEAGAVMITMTACEAGPVVIRHMIDARGTPWLIMEAGRLRYAVTLSELQAASQTWLGMRPRWTLPQLQGAIESHCLPHIKPATITQAVIILAGIAAWGRGWHGAVLPIEREVES
jgi:hypothetical protein